VGGRGWGGGGAEGVGVGGGGRDERMALSPERIQRGALEVLSEKKRRCGWVGGISGLFQPMGSGLRLE